MQAPLAPADLERCAGVYRLSRLLHAAADLGIAALLARRPRRCSELAAATRTNERTLRAVLDALCAWGVFDRDGDLYSINAVSERLLPGRDGGANVPLIAGWSGNEAVIEAFAGLDHTLRTGECGLVGLHGIDFHGYLARRPLVAARYNAAMESTADSFDACVAAVDWPHAGCVVDIGGGQGALLHALLREEPGLHGVCMDLPHVIARAVPAPEIAPRLTFLAQDAFTGVPPGAVAYLTSTVLRCFGDDRASLLLEKVRAAMTHPDAQLVCFEMLVPDERDDPFMALADVTARVVYGGQDRTREEFEAMFAAAGLRLDACVPVQGTMHALMCRRLPGA